LLMSVSWKSRKTFALKKTLHEKEELAELIRRLGFNTLSLKKWLVMIQSDTHMLAHDSGKFNSYGGFPIFQCSSMDAVPTCNQGGWSSGPFM